MIALTAIAAAASFGRPRLLPHAARACVARHRAAAMEEAAADWSFLDAAYLITCPDDDGSNPRLDRVLPLLRQVGLGDLVEVRSFERDDADRIRGCYSSHISVLQEAQRRVEGKRECNILVLEDNIDVSPRLSSDTLAAVREYVTDPAAGEPRSRCVSLRCIPPRRSPPPPPPPPRPSRHGAPGLHHVRAGAAGAASRHRQGDGEEPRAALLGASLQVERTSGARERIVRLLCTPDSVLGTTAYLVTRSGLDALLAEHARHGEGTVTEEGGGAETEGSYRESTGRRRE